MTPGGFTLREAKELFQSKQFGRLKETLSAAAVEKLEEEWAKASPFERVAFFKLMPPDRAEIFFERLPPDQQVLLLSTAGAGALGPLLEEMGPEQANKIFHELPDDMIQRMRRNLLGENY